MPEPFYDLSPVLFPDLEDLQDYQTQAGEPGPDVSWLGSFPAAGLCQPGELLDSLSLEMSSTTGDTP